MTASRAASSSPAIVSTDTPLGTVRDVFSFFHEPKNVVQLQVASDKTRYAWQNLSGFQYTMQILRDGPISELPERIDPTIGAVTFTRPGQPQETVSQHMGRFAMIFTPSWNKVSREQIIPDALIETIQHGGKPDIYLGGMVGKEMQHSFPDIKGLTNRYQWDIVFPDGDFYKGGVGGQGIYVSRSADAVVVWFSTGKQEEEIMARAIAKRVGAARS